MNSVLIAAGAPKDAQALASKFSAMGYRAVSTASSGAQARRMLSSAEYDLVLINAPLNDEFGCDLAVMAASESAAGVLLLVKSDLADEAGARVEDWGVFVLSRPLNMQMFHQALKLIAASGRRLAGLRHENIRLQGKIEEIRLTGRAKAVLMQYLNMTEAQAHRYLEKQAMDLRTTRREIAQNILKTYES